MSGPMNTKINSAAAENHNPSYNTVQVTTYIYFGDPLIDGCFRMSVNAGTLFVEKLVGGNWIPEANI